MASDGSVFLVVWSDENSGQIRAARYGADGTLLTATPIVVASAPGARYFPRVTFGGGNLRRGLA